MTKERTNYLKIVDEEFKDFEKDGRWLDIVETPEGGAKLSVGEDDLVCLEKIFVKLGRGGKKIEIQIGNEGGGLIPVDENGVQIPFVEVMRMFDD
jgi:hypothetical protein